MSPTAEAAAPIGWRAGAAVSHDAFRAGVAALAARLPDAAHVVNYCQDRLLFLAGLRAASLRGQVSLLPNDAGDRLLERLAATYPGLYALAEEAGPADGPPVPRLRIVGSLFRGSPADPPPPDLPHLDLASVAAFAFTSGSTGEPTAHPKRWGDLLTSATATAARLGLPEGASIVATVPPQHMYGLELSVLMPLVAAARIEAGRPFFPADVQAALAAVPSPRLLVTTPVHVRALLGSGLSLPPLALIVSATAPIGPGMALAAEQRFGAPLLEIYGCTEAGVVATRHPARDEAWWLQDHYHLAIHEGRSLLSGASLPVPVPLNDRIEPRDDRRFMLLGRQADLVNIAGKRASLAGLDRVLLEIEGVADGAFLLPGLPAGGVEGAVERLVAVVVAPGCLPETILGALRRKLDPAFVPRRIVLVEALPRDALGKLPRDALDALL